MARESSAANRGEFESSRFREFAGDEEVENDARGRGEQAGPPSADHAGDQHGRHQKKVERLVAERRGEQRPQDEGECDERQRDEVDRRTRLQRLVQHLARGLFGKL